MKINVFNGSIGLPSNKDPFRCASNSDQNSLSILNAKIEQYYINFTQSNKMFVVRAMTLYPFTLLVQTKLFPVLQMLNTMYRHYSVANGISYCE